VDLPWISLSDINENCQPTFYNFIGKAETLLERVQSMDRPPADIFEWITNFITKVGKF